MSTHIGRHQPPGRHTRTRNHQSQPQRHRILHQDQTFEGDGRQSRRLQATDQEDFALLPACVCENVQEF